MPHFHTRGLQRLPGSPLSISRVFSLSIGMATARSVVAACSSRKGVPLSRGLSNAEVHRYWLPWIALKGPERDSGGVVHVPRRRNCARGASSTQCGGEQSEGGGREAVASSESAGQQQCQAPLPTTPPSVTDWNLFRTRAHQAVDAIADYHVALGRSVSGSEPADLTAISTDDDGVDMIPLRGRPITVRGDLAAATARATDTWARREGLAATVTGQSIRNSFPSSACRPSDKSDHERRDGTPERSPPSSASHKHDSFSSADNGRDGVVLHHGDGEADAAMAQLLHTVMRGDLADGMLHWQHPKFYGYFPCRAAPSALLGEMLALGFNQPGFSWACSPTATELECLVMDWFARELGLPPAYHWAAASTATRDRRSGGGIIQPCATEATMVAMIGALGRLASQGAAAAPWLNDSSTSPSSVRDRCVVYFSDQSHFCIEKACRVLGIGHVRKLPATLCPRRHNWVLLPSTLQEAMVADSSSGLIPLLVHLNVGSTGTGAVDPCLELTAVARRFAATWIHIDAAYGGGALLCPELRSSVFGWDDARLPTASPARSTAAPLNHAADSTVGGSDRQILTASASSSPHSGVDEWGGKGEYEALLNAVDSVVINGSKWLGLLMGSSLLFTRHRDALKSQLGQSADIVTAASYAAESAHFQRTTGLVPTFGLGSCMHPAVPPHRPATCEGDRPTTVSVATADPLLPRVAPVDFKDYHLGLGRPFYAMKIYAVMQLDGGADGMRAIVRRHVRLAAYLARLLAASGRFDVVTTPIFGLVVCRVLNASPEVTQRLAERMIQRGVGYVVTTPCLGGVGLRVCFAHPAVGYLDVDQLVNSMVDLVSRGATEAPHS